MMHGPDYWKGYRDACASRSLSKGRFREVLRAFLSSREFAGLAERTKKDYSISIYHEQGIDAAFGDAAIEMFDHPQVRRVVYGWRDRFDSAKVADTRAGHLVAIVNWAVDKSYVKANHLSGMTKLYSADRSDIIWTPAELALFLHGDASRKIGAAPGWLQRLMATATETGLRPGDLHILSLGHFQETGNGMRIVIRTQKRKRMVSIPVTPRMQAIYDETPADTPEGRVLLNGRGQPYKSQNDMGQAVSRRRDECKIRETEPVAKRPRLYDARGTAATRLFEADATMREIATHMGWSIQHAAKMIETYVAMSPDASDGLREKLARAI